MNVPAAQTRDNLREVNVNGVRYLQADDVERWHRGMVARAEEWDELSEQVERLTEQRDKLAERLLADPDRAAIATLDGLQKLLPELLAEDVEQAGAILDWIGVAGDDLSLAERVRILALELATKQGYTLDEAERLCPTAEVSRV